MPSNQEVRHIANLARIKLTDQEVAKMQKELSAVLDYFKDLKDVDTTNIQATFQTQPLKNVMREDKAIPEDPETVEQMLNQAPQKQGREIKVGRISKT